MINATQAKDKKILTNKARSKYLTRVLVGLLLTVKRSKLKKSYWITTSCASALEQTGQKLTGKYCNQRWCNVCNRIRTAKLIAGYSEELRGLSDPWFVTLSRPNVTKKELPGEIQKLHDLFESIRRHFRKDKIIGLRKLECTYNPKSDTYHPHFHIIIDGRRKAAIFRRLWLNKSPQASKKANKGVKCYGSYEKELFKYFTKVVYKADDGSHKIHAPALNTIFEAMRKRRVFQPMGIKKYVPEDIEQQQSQEYTCLPDYEFESWYYESDFNDWVNTLGEPLTSYNPSSYMEQLVKFNCKPSQLKVQLYDDFTNINRAPLMIQRRKLHKSKPTNNDTKITQLQSLLGKRGKAIEAPMSRREVSRIAKTAPRSTDRPNDGFFRQLEKQVKKRYRGKAV